MAFLIPLLGFVGLCLYASLQVPLWEEFSLLTPFIWFWVTLADLYIGLGLFISFVYFVKRSTAHTLAWGIACLCLGNMASLVWLIVYRHDVKAVFNR
jgi:hypothetical protein